MKEVRYDSEVDALYIDLSEAPVANTEEVRPGIMLNFDAKGNVIGMEILDFQARLVEPELPAFPEGELVERGVVERIAEGLPVGAIKAR